MCKAQIYIEYISRYSEYAVFEILTFRMEQLGKKDLRRFLSGDDNDKKD